MSINTAPLHDVLRGAERQNASCILTLLNAGTDEIRLEVHHGLVQTARFGEALGEEAYDNILGLPDAMVKIEQLTVEPVPNLLPTPYSKKMAHAQRLSETRMRTLQELEASLPGCFRSLTRIDYNFMPSNVFPQQLFWTNWSTACLIGNRIRNSADPNLQVITGNLKDMTFEQGSMTMYAWEDKGNWILGSLTSPKKKAIVSKFVKPKK